MNRNVKSQPRTAKTLVLLAAAATALGACTPSDASEPAVRTAYGEAVRVGNGTARTYVTMQGDAPREVGVAFEEAALSGLPDHHAPGGIEIEPGHFTFEHVLSLPARNPTPYRHVVVNWNPTGHEPNGIYNLPHFDFHFYMISEAERAKIDRSDPEFQRRAERQPLPELVPQGYVLPAPLGVPGMGVHWVDPRSPELNGETFTQTFIFGAWDGKVIFAEPMITRAFLESKRDFSAPLPAPKKYGASGYYPTGYSIRWDEAAKEYRVALTGLVPRG